MYILSILLSLVFPRYHSDKCICCFFRIKDLFLLLILFYYSFTLNSLKNLSFIDKNRGELEPDLIIGLSHTMKNIEKLKKIAPTVSYTWGKLDYLTQHLEMGKLLNKEKEAQDWIDDFKNRAAAAGEDIRAKIGEDATVSVIESGDNGLYVFGDNWSRGTEIMYQEMNLKMPERVKEMTLNPRILYNISRSTS